MPVYGIVISVVLVIYYCFYRRLCLYVYTCRFLYCAADGVISYARYVGPYVLCKTMSNANVP